MKNNDNEIRKLLKDAIDYKADYAYGYIIKKCKEALALLSCETCKGTGKLPKGDNERHCRLLLCKNLQIRCSACDDYIDAKPCPDCK